MPLFGSSTKAPKQEKVQDQAPSRRGSLMSKNKLEAAVAAEKQSEAALQRAKIAVREARSEVTMLEKEAREEAKLADQHMRDAKALRKAADKLHG